MDHNLQRITLISDLNLVQRQSQRFCNAGHQLLDRANRALLQPIEQAFKLIGKTHQIIDAGLGTGDRPGQPFHLLKLAHQIRSTAKCLQHAGPHQRLTAALRIANSDPELFAHSRFIKLCNRHGAIRRIGRAQHQRSAVAGIIQTQTPAGLSRNGIAEIAKRGYRAPRSTQHPKLHSVQIDIDLRAIG